MALSGLYLVEKPGHWHRYLIHIIHIIRIPMSGSRVVGVGCVQQCLVQSQRELNSEHALVELLQGNIELESSRLKFFSFNVETPIQAPNL